MAHILQVVNKTVINAYLRTGKLYSEVLHFFNSSPNIVRSSDGEDDKCIQHSGEKPQGKRNLRETHEDGG
jgi:hypothetical protein